MRIRIHRGTREIGGTCVEVEAEGQRLLLDLGLPLGAKPKNARLPDVSGLVGERDPSLLGVVVSHGHQDHWGLLPEVAPHVPVFLGEATERILREAAFFSPAGHDFRAAGHLKNRRPFRVGPFRITPFLMDHAAFDAHAVLVESGGGRLFYSGDLRAHGRKAKLFERLVASPPGNIDLLLLEGTLVAASGQAARPVVSEDDVERACIESFRATRGAVLAVYSAQNIDRMVTLYRAALQSGRDFVMDLYTATIARATRHPTIPCPGPDWPRVRVYVPERVRREIKKAGQFERVSSLGPARIYRRELRARGPRLVVTFRYSMAEELERDGCVEDARLIWSMWRRSFEEDKQIQGFLRRNPGLPHEVLHASGHAPPEDLARLVVAMRPGAVVPIHTEGGDGFAAMAPGARVVRLADGEWMDVERNR